MIITRLKTVWFAAVGMAFAAPLQAASPVSLDSEVKVERTVNEGGVDRRILAPPVDVVPGDRLVFETNYANKSDKAVDNFVVTNPLPAAVKLAEQDSTFDMSIDGGKTYFASIASLTVPDEEAGSRAASLSDVTHIRWTIPRVAAGESGSVSYHAIVR